MNNRRADRRHRLSRVELKDRRCRNQHPWQLLPGTGALQESTEVRYRSAIAATCIPFLVECTSAISTFRSLRQRYCVARTARSRLVATRLDRRRGREGQCPQQGSPVSRSMASNPRHPSAARARLGSLLAQRSFKRRVFAHLAPGFMRGVLHASVKAYGRHPRMYSRLCGYSRACLTPYVIAPCQFVRSAPRLQS